MKEKRPKADQAANVTGCLWTDQIGAYLLGAVDDQKMEAIEAHLVDCSRCQGVADALDSTSDSLVDLLRQPVPAEHTEERECQKAVRNVKAIGPTLAALSESSGSDFSAGAEPMPAWLREYRILERLGGHMGVVYKAVDTKRGRLVALKVLPTQLLQERRVVRRFQREIRAVLALKHPNIVRAYAAQTVDSERLLVMEYLDGTNLSELVLAHGPLAVSDACELVRQAAIALQCVFENGLVHRDVKPSNLMLTRQGSVKLLDLGLARFLEPCVPDGETSKSGLAIGTADYMSPEQITDSHNADIRADIYGLGCSFYKLLAGHAPFDTPEYRSRLARLAAHLKVTIPPIQTLRPDVPTAVAFVLGRMLAKKPEERFAAPAQVAAGLAPFAKGSRLSKLIASPTANRQCT